jgi:cytochrome P450
VGCNPDIHGRKRYSAISPTLFCQRVRSHLCFPPQTVSAMKTFVLCMLLNPRVQQKAQAEIDAVIGSDRLPKLTDRSSLPYLDACIKEALRWGPVTPEGLPHLSRSDDVYNGWLIPAGTIIIGNIWYVAFPRAREEMMSMLMNAPRGMAHDPETYADPFEFRPERFLGSRPELDPDFTFGFGRRVCAGRALAETSIFLFAAHLLALCDVRRAQNPDGTAVEVKVEYENDGIV